MHFVFNISGITVCNVIVIMFKCSYADRWSVKLLAILKSEFRKFLNYPLLLNVYSDSKLVFWGWRCFDNRIRYIHILMRLFSYLVLYNLVTYVIYIIL